MVVNEIGVGKYGTKYQSHEDQRKENRVTS